MTNKQTRSGKSQLNFLDEIIVDNFAGAAGPPQAWNWQQGVRWQSPSTMTLMQS